MQRAGGAPKVARETKDKQPETLRYWWLTKPTAAQQEGKPCGDGNISQRVMGYNPR